MTSLDPATAPVDELAPHFDRHDPAHGAAVGGARL
jgi:hypothetical protein